MPKDTQELVYQINLISSSHAQLFKQNLNSTFIEMKALFLKAF